MTAAASTDAGDRSLRSAFAWCRRYARGRNENFTVVSWFLPRELRPHFFALYAFCRYTDDLGDEAAGDRLALLDRWERELRACFAGRPSGPLFTALHDTMTRFSIPENLFLRLIEANRIDQRISSFETIEQLYDYCSYSATPVGRMVLHVLGYRDEQRLQLADATCIGLQIANFWQDVAVDLVKGRIYLPRADMRCFGYSEDDLRRGVVNPAFRRLMRFEVARARDLFARGRKLEALVDRRVRPDVSLFRLGGEAALDAIAAANYDVLSHRPAVSKAHKAALALRVAVSVKLRT